MLITFKGREKIIICLILIFFIIKKMKLYAKQ